MSKSRPTGIVWDANPVELTEEEFFVFRGPDEPVITPHGGACSFCGETKPDVFSIGNKGDTCADCLRFNANRSWEFRDEKIKFWQSKKHR